MKGGPSAAGEGHGRVWPSMPAGAALRQPPARQVVCPPHPLGREVDGAAAVRVVLAQHALRIQAAQAPAGARGPAPPGRACRAHQASWHCRQAGRQCHGRGSSGQPRPERPGAAWATGGRSRAAEARQAACALTGSRGGTPAAGPAAPGRPQCNRAAAGWPGSPPPPAAPPPGPLWGSAARQRPVQTAARGSVCTPAGQGQGWWCGKGSSRPVGWDHAGKSGGPARGCCLRQAACGCTSALLQPDCMPCQSALAATPGRSGCQRRGAAGRTGARKLPPRVRAAAGGLCWPGCTVEALPWQLACSKPAAPHLECSRGHAVELGRDPHPAGAPLVIRRHIGGARAPAGASKGRPLRARKPPLAQGPEAPLRH